VLTANLGAALAGCGRAREALETFSKLRGPLAGDEVVERWREAATRSDAEEAT
jgi:hypothetical protein